jgi:crotonobetainyl-CoA:carnitine CoA-transferase CaiB-like acyl-CoA transferase
VLELPDLAADPALADNAARVVQRERVMARLREAAAALGARRAGRGLSCRRRAGGAGQRRRPGACRPACACARHGRRLRPSDGRALPRPAPAVQVRRLRPAALGRPPLLGEHTDALLGEVGFAADAIAQLRADKVVS